MKETARYHGWPAAFQLVFLRIFRRFARFERVFLYELREPPPGKNLPSPDQSRLAKPEDLFPFAGDRAFDFAEFDRTMIEKLYQSGHRCLFNIVEGKIAGYSWMTPDAVTIPKLDIMFRLKPDEAYIYKGFTHPDFRGHNLGVVRYLSWLQWLRQNGRSAILCDFAFDNKATLTRVGKLGMKQIGSATLFQIGPIRKLWRSGEFCRRKLEPI